MLLNKAILENGYSFTIPIHEKCKHLQREIEVEVPEMVKKYRMNEHGKMEEYMDVAFEEVEEEIIDVHPDYELDENTGNFKRKLIDWNLELFSEKEILAGVIASNRVAKAKDRVLSKKPKLRKITIQIGKKKKQG